LLHHRNNPIYKNNNHLKIIDYLYLHKLSKLINQMKCKSGRTDDKFNILLFINQRSEVCKHMSWLKVIVIENVNCYKTCNLCLLDQSIPGKFDDNFNKLLLNQFQKMKICRGIEHLKDTDYHYRCILCKNLSGYLYIKNMKNGKLKISIE
jgi:hypothetical protein